MFVIAWQFDVLPEKTEEFEREYGPEGVWRDLFARSPGYFGTRLLRDTAKVQRYVTLDLWTSEESFREFRDTFREEYEALDARLERLTAAEVQLGAFDAEASSAEVV